MKLKQQKHRMQEMTIKIEKFTPNRNRKKREREREQAKILC